MVGSAWASNITHLVGAHQNKGEHERVEYAPTDKVLHFLAICLGISKRDATAMRLRVYVRQPCVELRSGPLWVVVLRFIIARLDPGSGVWKRLSSPLHHHHLHRQGRKRQEARGTGTVGAEAGGKKQKVASGTIGQERRRQWRQEHPFLCLPRLLTGRTTLLSRTLHKHSNPFYFFYLRFLSAVHF